MVVEGEDHLVISHRLAIPECLRGATMTFGFLTSVENALASPIFAERLSISEALEAGHGRHKHAKRSEYRSDCAVLYGVVLYGVVEKDDV
jgi:hypothetical protein